MNGTATAIHSPRPAKIMPMVWGEKCSLVSISRVRLVCSVPKWLPRTKMQASSRIGLGRMTSPR